MISIVTPSYGQPDWLRLAIASVADQEGVVSEHIVQDAGTPQIESILDTHFAPLLSTGRLKLFVEKDDGMYDAINRGLKRTSGSICAYLNSDEQYLPNALAMVAGFFATHREVDVLFCDVILVTRDGAPISYRRSVLPKRSHLRAAHLNTSTCATFFRRSLVDRGLLFDSQWKAAGDAVWVDHLLSQKIKMALLPLPSSVFTFTGDNLGASALSRAEDAKWKRQAKQTVSQPWLTVLLHRLRKFLAGAYRMRHVAIDIYTLASPNERKHFEEPRVGFFWPAKTGESTGLPE